MNTYDVSQDRIPPARWQNLGELKLPVAPQMEDTLRLWLLDRLGPLNLHAYLLDQVLKSAQNTIARARESLQAVEAGHLHFLIFAPESFRSKGQTWGFFHIEKRGTPTDEGNPPDHWIAYYLYLEG